MYYGGSISIGVPIVVIMTIFVNWCLLDCQVDAMKAMML